MVGMDPWTVSALERSKHDQQFASLGPVGGTVTGEQAKGFLMQSQLPLPLLGKIWALADYNADGKMNAAEFSVACKLITMKLQGHEVPEALPPALRATLVAQSAAVNGSAALAAIPMAVGNVPVIPAVPVPVASPLVPAAAPVIPVVAPVAAVVPSASISSPNTSLPRSPSLASQDSGSGISGSLPGDSAAWAVPQSSRLRYVQQFNQLDKSKSGFLSGAQARGVLMQSGLSTALLAQIWSLADVNTDGRLSTDEFILAMHLCDTAKQGSVLPSSLPADLVPPSFRHAGDASDSTKTLSSQNSFEDKRRENFNKGQAVLDLRRKALEEQQQREQEDRQRKEREIQEKQERIRREQEQRRQQELQQQLEAQHLLQQQQQEEARRREQEQLEAQQREELARQQREQQRREEWENSKRKELESMRERQQEQLLKLKAQNNQLNIQLETATERVKTLTKSIGETRASVTQVKSTIDGMRSTRDASLSELTSLKSQLREQNNRLLQANQERAKLDMSGGSVNGEANLDSRRQALEQLREKATAAETECEEKDVAVETCRQQLEAAGERLQLLAERCRESHQQLKDSQREVRKLCNHPTPTASGNTRSSSDVHGWQANFSSGFDSDANAALSSGNTDTVWGQQSTHSQLVSSTSSTAWQNGVSPTKNRVAYRALFDFDGRSHDELSFHAGDTIMISVSEESSDWLEGELNGQTGWLPQSYVEPLHSVTNGSGDSVDTHLVADTIQSDSTEIKPEEQQQQQHVYDTVPDADTDVYVAVYSFSSSETGDLSFEQGEHILVTAKNGDWWTGELNGVSGIFPSNYVQPVETRTAEVTASEQLPPQPEAATVTDGSQQKRKGEVAVVLAEYDATSGEQLSLSRGQLVMVRKKSNTGWWEGEIQMRGKQRQVGWFPASFVKLKTSRRMSLPDISDPAMPEAQCPGDAPPPDPHAPKDLVVAQYAYTAQHDDELTFDTDDVITVINKDDMSWWKGELNGAVGLFPSNYVVPKPTQSVLHFEVSTHEEVYETVDAEEIHYDLTAEERDMDRKRTAAVDELINSEESYISSLSSVEELFRKPLVASGLLTIIEARTIFTNLHEIVSTNRRLMVALKMREKMAAKQNISLSIGDVMNKNIGDMHQCYMRFCSGQKRAVQLVQQKQECAEFNRMLTKLQNDSRLGGLPLTSFFLQPMQRVTKYPLLLKQVLKYTFEGHPDLNNVKEAVVAAENLCKQVNSGVGEAENTNMLDWLQNRIDLSALKERLVFNSETNMLGPRKLLHFGVLKKAKSGRELLVFLFNDFLMFTTVGGHISISSIQLANFETHLADAKLKLYRMPIMTTALVVNVDETSQDYSWTISRAGEKQLQDEELSVTVTASTSSSRNSWLKHIEEAVHAARDQLEKQRQCQYQRLDAAPEDQPVPCARLLVTVIAASRLQGRDENGKSDPYCELTLAHQVRRTPVVPSTLNPRWECSLQFHVFDLTEDVLTVGVFDRDLFGPDDPLGRNEIRLADLMRDLGSHRHGMVIRRVPLLDVRRGEVDLRLDVILHEK